MAGGAARGRSQIATHCGEAVLLAAARFNTGGLQVTARVAQLHTPAGSAHRAPDGARAQCRMLSRDRALLPAQGTVCPRHAAEVQITAAARPRSARSQPP